MKPNSCELALLLLALGRAGVELAPHPIEPAKLRHRPAELPPDLTAHLRTHRAAVLGLLIDGYAPGGGTDAEYVLGERLGVAESLGMATHPGSPAWLLAAGESMGIRCDFATYRVHSEHGPVDDSHSGGGEGERPIALCNSQGVGRGP